MKKLAEDYTRFSSIFRTSVFLENWSNVENFNMRF